MGADGGEKQSDDDRAEDADAEELICETSEKARQPSDAVESFDDIVTIIYEHVQLLASEQMIRVSDEKKSE